MKADTKCRIEEWTTKALRSGTADHLELMSILVEQLQAGFQEVEDRLIALEARVAELEKAG